MKVICFIPIYGYHIFFCDGGDSNKKWPLKINKMTESCNEKLMDVASFGHKVMNFHISEAVAPLYLCTY